MCPILNGDGIESYNTSWEDIEITINTLPDNFKVYV